MRYPVAKRINRVIFTTVLTNIIAFLATSSSPAQTCSDFEAGGHTCREAFHAPQIPGDRERNGTTASKSLVASLLMGVDFFTGSLDLTQDILYAQCQSRNPPANATWPDGCGPAGMDLALAALGFPNWWNFSSTTQSTAMSKLVHAVEQYGSPVAVPIYGRADHWATVFRLARFSGALSHVTFYDAVAAGCCDSGFNTGSDGIQTRAAGVWLSQYYRILVGPIANNDTYYNKYVVIYDPPAGVAAEPVEPIELALPRSPLGPGERMSLQLAEQHAWDSLRLAGLEPHFLPIARESRDVAAWRVNGVWPDGSPWDYYLVAFLDGAGSLLAMMQMDASTGAYQASWVPATPQPFYGLDYERARANASSVLGRDEILLDGLLAWDSDGVHPVSRSPWIPYYEFEIRSKHGEQRGAVFVSLHDGAVMHGSDSCRMTRHQRPLQCYYH